MVAPVEEYAVQLLEEFNGKRLKSTAQGGPRHRWWEREEDAERAGGRVRASHQPRAEALRHRLLPHSAAAAGSLAGRLLLVQRTGFG